MARFEAIVLTPAGSGDAAIAIAACRAGARGLLDLEYSPATDLAGLQQLERFTSGPFGVKFGRYGAELVERLCHRPPARLAWVLLAGGEHAELPRWIQALRSLPVQVLLEATTLAEAQLAEELGVDGLVLKGHEAGGRVSSYTAFVLVQQWLASRKDSRCPFWVQGGIGLNTAAACRTAGAAGIVLDSQVLLARESRLAEASRQLLTSFDGSETLCLGERLGEAYRCYTRPGLAPVEELVRREAQLADEPPSADRLERWRQAVRQQLGAGLWLLGQDAAFARRLADQFGTVAGIVQGLLRRAQSQAEATRRLQPLAEGSALARRHRTRYPIVQGPMTRVSDTAAFAEAVSAAGGLPFLALALMKRPETEKLLRETKARVGDRSWGAGILGFAPPEIRREQIEAIKATRPPFALIAGGRPDQARELEKEGIPTYLHVPSPGLLRMFLRDGARRFIFEGRECGGHVGPRTSFVLWETMVEALLEHLGPNGQGEDLHVLFAGGIHDRVSAAMVATLAAPLAERGVAVGVLLGTAYLFTREAVQSGAIVSQFQQEALGCRDTVLLETGPGHAIRCVPTPYFEIFEREKRRLLSEGRSPDELRDALEAMNIGRLRIASKGIDRAASNLRSHGDARPADGFVTLSPDEQRRQGMYMIGQVACLRDQVVTMDELHADISGGSGRFLEESAGTVPTAEPELMGARPCDVAIIGMACLFPKANSVRQYWENILAKVDAITEVPPDHWNWRLYYDPNPKARDKIYSKWGGFLDDVPFDPLVYGMPPNSLTSIEPMQLLVLEAVRQALADAGYADRPFARERTSVVLGAGGGAAQLAMAYGMRSYLPMLTSVPGLEHIGDEVLKKAEAFLPEWSEDSFPGILLNVAAGRVANRFNFGGANFSIDAACGSSLAALYAGTRELEMGTSDLVVLLGADTVQNPFTYLLFSKTHAFSPRGRCSTFDEAADGIVIGEGVAALILKRLADAERDGDRIYAVIKGVGASSDGKDKGLTAPRPEGQLRALERAYAKAGISPARVGLVEAHGTGTVVGDQTEVQALGKVFREAGARPRYCALGSVKSMIGHTKCAAGLAGLINATLALHHKTLPPILVQQPNSKANFEQSPFFLNTEPRPWVHGEEHPRTAGVSAFGFGGTNFHAVLEEYTGDYLRDGTRRSPPALPRWPAELFVWRKPDRKALRESLEGIRRALARGARPEPGDLAWSLWLEARNETGPCLLAIVAASIDDLNEKLAAALTALNDEGRRQGQDPRGIWWQTALGGPEGKVAFLFPGQGSQYPNMLAQLALAFPEVRQAFDDAERVLAGKLDRPLGKLIFPPSAFTPQQEQEARQALTRTNVAQPAIGAASVGMLSLLRALGLDADFFAGHSYGDYVALYAAGALSQEELIRLSYERGRAIVEATDQMPGGMAAIDAGAEAVAAVIAGIAGVTAANLNSPQQTVISGTRAGIQQALARLQERGIRGQELPVACGFHSPLVAPAQEPFAQALRACRFRAPDRPVYANTTAAPYPADPEAICRLLAEHITSPVRFKDEVTALYQAGARIFIEVGPQTVLTGLVGQTLSSQPHLAVASDSKNRPGLVQLQHLLAQLLVRGLPLRLDRLYEDRGLRPLDLANLERETGQPKLSPTTWLVNSTRVRPLNGPEPMLLGQVRPAATAARPPEVAPKSPTTPTRATTMENGHPTPNSVPAVPAAVPPAPLPAVNALPGDEATQVMLRFQDLMARFLDTQRTVMSSYFGTPLASVQPAAGQPAVNGQPVLPPAAAAPSPPPPPPVQPPQAPAPATASSVESIETSAPAANGSRRDAITAQLLDIVRQRTGYPLEMLGLDLDLEADLGIDSIKRVEILGSLADSGNGNGSGGNHEMEKLTGIKTLRGIIDCLVGPENGHGNGSAEAHEGNGHVSGGPESVGGGRGGIQRMLVELVDAPLPADPTPVRPSGAVLITDDGRGIASRLAEQLRDRGQAVVVVRSAALKGNGGGFQADLSNPQAVDNLLQRLRQQVGPVAGLIHLLPLAEPPSGETWPARMQREVKSLFLLARGLADELCHSASGGTAVLLAATALGPDCPLQAGANGHEADAFFPGSGGVGGIVKSLAHEWPEVLVRVVNLPEPRRSPEELADRLLAELGDLDGPNEIVYEQDRRLTPVCTPAPVDLDQPPTLTLDAKSTILLTGGARGITAAVALELAQRYQPTLILVGRSPLPAAEEPADTASLTTAAELKAALIQRLKREGAAVNPAAVEAAYHRLLQDREIRANLARLEQAGARVHYYSANVRDEAAFAAVIDEVYRRFGHLDGIIHGAGVIQDKLIRDKTPESFDRVFSTKVDSALILARHVRPERLKFCAFFSSVAGRFGNRGQSDYAAANEVLSKLARYLDCRWPGRVVSVVWGPWSTIGMVAELEQHLGQRGLVMIPPDVGPLFLVEELTHGLKGECEVVIAGDVGQLAVGSKQLASSQS
jgi:acyl transferase domain-containing protein/NAD(P)H-dependent flavin oxidoreductase YrpB (nitropropane dioxygenase family)/NAD(P)-dependent dehydrogenase (short-subunit alcohol dehydrogenase family)